MFLNTELVTEGGLMSYAPDFSRLCAENREFDLPKTVRPTPPRYYLLHSGHYFTAWNKTSEDVRHPDGHKRVVCGADMSHER